MRNATIIGNVVADPELRYTPSGAAVASFTVAENRKKKNNQTGEYEDAGTTYYRCSAWRDLAENVTETLTRGTRVIIQGEIYAEEFERKDGTGKSISLQCQVEAIGPDLRYATAQITKKTNNSSGASNTRNTPTTQTEDPWATGTDEPPF